jgi:hypothetical protein
MWLSLALLVCAVGLLYRAVPGRAAALLVAAGVLVSLLLLVVYTASDRLTGAGITAAVLYHLRAGMEGAGLGGFAILMAATATAVLVSGAAAALAFRLVRGDHAVRHAGVRRLAGLGLILAALGVNPATHDLARLAGNARMAAAPPGLPPPHFATVAEVSFPGPRRNVVLVFVESLERTYLDETRFPGLMPNLAALEAQATSFTDITQVSEASWSIAGMLASQCGIPLVGSGAGFDSFLPGATCMGDLLKAEGYDLTYMDAANLNFAGIGTFYASHGFGTVIGLPEIAAGLDDPGYLNEWGLNDDSLLDAVARRFDALSTGNAPFGLVTLTVGTHHPYGYMSRSCGEKTYADGTNAFLNAVHCADQVVAGFIRHVIDSPAFADTVLVVASDHLAMPNLAQERLEAGERRNLLMVFAPGLPPGQNDKPGSTLDTAPTLLGLLGAPTPALGYGRDLLGEAPTLRAGEPGLDALIEAGRAHLGAMWSYPEIRDGIRVDPAAGEVELGDRRLDYPLLLWLDEELAVTAVDFEAGADVKLPERMADLPTNQRFLWLDSCARTAVFSLTAPADAAGTCVLAGRLDSAALRQFPVAGDGVIAAGDLAAAFAEGGSLAVSGPLLADLALRRQLATADIVEYRPANGLTGAVAIRSAGYPNGDSWVVNPAQGDRVKLVRGLTLLGLTPDRAPVKLGHVDTCGYGGRLPDLVPLEGSFAAVIAAQSGRFGAFLIAAHSSVVCYEVDPGLAPLFEGLHLSTWRDLWYEEPYVALIAGNGEVREFTAAPRTVLGLSLTDVMPPARTEVQRRLDWLPRIGRAEDAGGAASVETVAAKAADFDLVAVGLDWTSDGKPVCLEGWDAPFLAAAGAAPTGPLALADVIGRARAAGVDSPCTLDGLARWLDGQPGARLVLDLRAGAPDALALVADSHPGLRTRIVPMIQRPEDYAPVRDLGFEDVIWSLDSQSGDDAAVLSWLARMDLLGLVMPSDRLEAGLARQARAATGVLTWADGIGTLPAMDAAVQAGAAEIVTETLVPTPLLRFEAVSAGYEAGSSTLRQLDGEDLVLPRGVNLVALGPAGPPELLAGFDECSVLDSGIPADPRPFRLALAAARAEGRSLAVVVHDSAFCLENVLAPVLADSPLSLAAKIGFREPYIGLIHADGRVLEYTGSPGGRLREILGVEARP